MKKNEGVLVSFTGIDGCGKSTVIREVKTQLDNRGVSSDIFINHEPYSQFWNAYKKINAAIVQYGYQIPYDIDRLLQSVELVTKCETELPKLLQTRDVVLSDRYVIDKIIYGRLKGLPILAEKALTVIQRLPDVTIFIDVSVQSAMSRIAQKGGPVDWKEEPEMLKKAQKAYHHIIENKEYEKYNIIRINGEQKIQEVVSSSLDLILARLT
ncbi:deoxynucleoside kinase [Candidatus Woesearchaeota archaeon]|nr:deoxynucleoside kinase [Candidatus Woesearchaeota archaeon]